VGAALSARAEPQRPWTGSTPRRAGGPPAGTASPAKPAGGRSPPSQLAAQAGSPQGQPGSPRSAPGGSRRAAQQGVPGQPYDIDSHPGAIRCFRDPQHQRTSPALRTGSPSVRGEECAGFVGKDATGCGHARLATRAHTSGPEGVLGPGVQGGAEPQQPLRRPFAPGAAAPASPAASPLAQGVPTPRGFGVDEATEAPPPSTPQWPSPQHRQSRGAAAGGCSPGGGSCSPSNSGLGANEYTPHLVNSPGRGQAQPADVDRGSVRRRQPPRGMPGVPLGTGGSPRPASPRVFEPLERVQVSSPPRWK